jgi:predicted dienelactone hydrolase
MKIKTIYFVLALLTLVNLPFNPINGQSKDNLFVFGDALPDAPELSKRGDFDVGVRTIDLVNKNQIDILNSKEGLDPRYDRPLKVEVWYPSEKFDKENLITYKDVLGLAGDPKRPLIPFTFKGRAKRSANPEKGEGPFPLIIVSHGYVGSRYLMTYLTENLASKGYVVVAIDHTESTFQDAAPFQSTLLNRPKDILFVIDEISKMGMDEKNDLLSGLVDADNTAIIGYSMGGYGALNAAGAAYSDFAINLFAGMTGGSKALTSRGMNSSEFTNSYDPRIKAVVAFAPWGMARGVWNLETLKGLKVPTFFIVGSQDDISGYEKGVKAIYNGAINAERYLLTYKNARHNVAPNPPPIEAMKPDLHIDEYYRYAEPVWDERKINNINQHFVTAFLGKLLKKQDYDTYLDLPENSNTETWTGFIPRSSPGLELLHATPQQK